MASSKNGKTPKPLAEYGIAASSPQPAEVPTDGSSERTTGEDDQAMVDDSATIPQASPAPFPTAATIEGTERKDSHIATDGSDATPQTSSQTNTVSIGNHNRQPQGKNNQTTEDGSTAGITPITNGASDNETGDVALCSAVAESPEVFTVLEQPLNAHARIGESPRNCWERLRKEARAAGMPRGQGPGSAYEWATRETDRLFPPREPEPEAESPGPEFIEEPEAAAVDSPEPIEPEEPPPSPIPSDQGVPGLGTIPEGWPKLAANASLQAEIAWVSANRLLVRDGTGVDLSRALSPAPSYSALSWLETSILFPSKFADISVKATQNQEDEAQHVRREKLAIEEIRALLAEMMED